MVHFSLVRYGTLEKFLVRVILHLRATFLIGEMSCTRAISQVKTKNEYFSIPSNFGCKEAECRCKVGTVGGVKHFSKLGNLFPLKQ